MAIFIAMQKKILAKVKNISLVEWLSIVPLLALPMMLNLRVFPFVAPNEEPKWAVLILCGLLMTIIAGLILWNRREALGVPVSIPSFFLFIYLLILGVGIWIGPNVIEGVIRFSFWVVCIVVWVLAVYAWRNIEQWRSWLVWSVSFAALLFSIRFWWSYFLDYGKLGYNVGVLFSPIGHVNFTGDVLIVLLPMLLWILASYSSPILRVFNWFSVMTVSCVLLVAASRGALGGMVVGAFLWGGFFLKRVIVAQEKVKLKAAYVWVASALLVSVVIYTSLPYHFRDAARLSGTLHATANVAEGRTLNPGVTQPPFAGLWSHLYPLIGDRTPIFASTTAMALDAPWLGQGTGNFAWIYPHYSNLFPDFRDTLSSAKTFTTNPHNVILQIASQNGIPATFIFIGLLVLVWWRLLSASLRKWDAWTASGLLAISAAIFDAMFNHVFFNPASMFVFALLGGGWWATISKPEVRYFSLPAIASRGAAIGVILTAVILFVWPARWITSEWYTGWAMAYVSQAGVQQKRGNQSATQYYMKLASENYRTAYDLDTYNFRAVYGVAQIAYSRRRFEEAVGLLQHFESIFPYNAPALNMLGAAHMMRGETDQAIAALQRALQVLPDFELAQQNLARAKQMKRLAEQRRSSYEWNNQ